MFDILQGDMTRSKVILTFTCLKMYIARSGDTSGSRTTLFETPPVFQGFFANVYACSNLAGIIWVFGHVVCDLLRNHPTAARDVMRTTYGQRYREVAHAHHLPKNQYEIRGFFAHALFVPKNPNVIVFSGSGSVNGTTKNPGFLDFGFCQCKWAYWVSSESLTFLW